MPFKTSALLAHAASQFGTVPWRQKKGSRDGNSAHRLWNVQRVASLPRQVNISCRLPSSYRDYTLTNLVASVVQDNVSGLLVPPSRF